MKKLLLLLLLIPVSGFAEVQDISCERAKEIMQPSIVYRVYHDPTDRQTIDYTRTFEIPFMRTERTAGFSNLCDFEWKYITPDVTLTGSWTARARSTLYYISNVQWNIYGEKEFSEYEWKIKQDAMKNEIQKREEERNKTLSEEARSRAESVIKGQEELKKAEEEARKAIAEKLALMNTGSTNTGSIEIIKPKPLTLKEKRVLRLKELREKRLARLKSQAK